MAKYFEVKTGKNAGYYITIDKDDKKSYDILAKTWGILPYEYNSGLYIYHHVSPTQELLWTHTRFTGGYTNYNYQSQLELLNLLRP
jgi:hypothetical protein